MARSPYEIVCQNSLKAEGYVTDYKARPTMMPRNYSVDFFGLFDIIAFKEEDRFVRWISVKGRAGVPGAHRKEIEAFKLPPGNQKEIWTFRDKKKIRKEIIE